MLVELLGPVTVTGSSGGTALRGKAAGVLSVLALRVGRPVPVAELVEAVWSDRAPTTAVKSIQNQIAFLRKVLPSGSITTAGGSYTLDIDSASVDVLQFERMIASGDQLAGRQAWDAAAAAFSSALELWRGPPFVDLDDSAVLGAERVRLDELRCHAEEERAEADLALGRHHNVVAELEAAAARAPLRERRWSQLMLALHRSGRQADALRAYQRVRRTLRDELGIEPSPALAELEDAILMAKPHLDWVPPVPSGGRAVRRDATLPAALRAAAAELFVGRTDELEALLEAYAAADVGRRQVRFVCGEPGIGKTTLVARAADAMSAAGAVVQLGRCDEDLGSPYRSFLDAVAGFDRVDGFDRADLDDPADGAGGAEPSADPWFRVLPALPEFAAWLERVRPDARDPETERYLLISGMVRLIAEAAQREPLVLVLEDLQWADPPTLQLLRRLVSETSDERLLILGTYRDELPGDHPLLRLQADHADDPDVRRIGLDGLDLVHAVQLVDAAADQSLGGPGRGLAEVLHRESSGHPFFMRHLLRHMLEDGTIDVGADGRWQIEPTARLTGVPDSVREVILARVGRLGSDADVLRAVAVSVAEVDLDELAAVMEADDAAVLSALEHGVASRLVTEVPDRPGRFRLSHPLVRRTLYDDLIASRRGFLHRRYAEVAEAQHPTVDGGAARGLAHHWSRTLRPTDRARAIPYAGLAGDWLLERLAPEAAITWYRRALDLLEAAGPSGGPSVDPASAHGKDAAMCALLVRLGDAQRQTGDPDFRQTLLDAARLADRIDDPALLVAAALANTRGFFSSSGIVDTERVDVLRLALDRIDVVDTTSRAQLLALLASELLWSDDLTERNVIAEEAISVARASGNPSTILRVLNLVYSATWTPDNLEERLERTSEAVAVARELGDEVGEFFALTFTTAAFYECARDVAGVISRMNEIADHLGQPTLKWVCRWVDAVEGTRVGDSEQAELAAEAALALGSAAGEPDVLVFYGTQLAYVRWLQGRRDELVPLLVPLADEMDRVLAFPPLLAACLLDAADTAGARELLGRELPHLDDRPANFTWLAGIIFWADIVWRLDDAEAASRLVPKLAPYARLISFNGISVQGPVADALGCLVTLLGDYDAADQYFDIADALSERLAAPFFIARALLHRADMQVLRDRPGDRSHAASHRGAALEIARRHGFAGIARDAEDASARVGD